MRHDKHAEMMAMLIDGVHPSPAVDRWLGSERGQRELSAYRRVLRALDRLYGARGYATIYYCGVSTPIGRLLVAAGDEGLVRVSFRQSEASFVAELRRRLRAPVERSSSRTSEIVHQLRAYFAGTRRTFDVPIDLRHITPFQRRVLQATAEIPVGQVVSYHDIARRVGRPRGSRAVGQALGRNPVPIVIPCHRVVASGGSIGGYGGGLRIKRKLLRLEGSAAAGWA